MSTRPPKLPTWASGAGDNVQPTNGEITAGWPASQTPPSRQRFNWFFNLVMNGVQYLVRRGISDWTSDEDYSIGDKSMGSDLKTYIAIQASTNKDPVSEPTYWAPWALTQDDADTRYALKNGDDTEVFEVADAVDPQDAIPLGQADDRYLQYVTPGQPISSLELEAAVIGNRKHISTADVVYEYTVDQDFIAAFLRVVSGGGGGGSGGGTANNASEDYGSAGGGGGSSGCGVVLHLSGLIIGTIIRVTIGASGTGGAQTGNGQAGLAGSAANTTTIDIIDPYGNNILQIVLPGGNPGAGSPPGGVNSCTGAAGGAGPAARIAIAQYHYGHLFNGSNGAPGLCNGGIGGPGGDGGIITPLPNDNATTAAAGGAVGAPGQTGGDGFYLQAYPYSLGMGGGGGGGVPAGNTQGGAGGHGAPGGVIMKVQKRNYR